MLKQTPEPELKHCLLHPNQQKNEQINLYLNCMKIPEIKS